MFSLLIPVLDCPARRSLPERSFVSARAVFFAVVVSSGGWIALPSHAEGLRVPQSTSDQWSSWQARVGSVVQARPALDVALSTTVPLPNQRRSVNVSVLGDYYFTGPGFATSNVRGGLRATTGWLVGSDLATTMPQGGHILSTNARSSLLPLDDASSNGAAYLGIGYTRLWQRQGLGIAADLGVTSSATNLRDGNGLAVNDGRIRPTVRLGVAYQF